MFRKIALFIFAVVLVSSLTLCFQAEAGDLPLTVTRGGTGISTVTEGQSIWGSEIDHLIASSSMTMDMSTGAITIGTVVISAVTDGDLTVSGDVGIGTSTPAENLVVTSVATTTIFADTATSTSGGNIILKDSDGVGCSEIYILDGTITSATITCPY